MVPVETYWTVAPDDIARSSGLLVIIAWALLISGFGWGWAGAGTAAADAVGFVTGTVGGSGGGGAIWFGIDGAALLDLVVSVPAEVIAGGGDMTGDIAAAAPTAGDTAAAEA